MRTPNRFTVDEIVAAWQQAKREAGVYTPERVALRRAILQSLAQGRPIGQAQAAAASGLPPATVAAFFAEMAEIGGADFDANCPIVGAPIRLTITPRGVTTVEPTNVVVSVNIPGPPSTCQTDAQALDGAASASCSAMRYLRTRDEGEQWRTTHPSVAILSLADAWQVANAVWIEPFWQALATL